LKEAPFVFKFDFGLEELPEEPGIILVRGPRQYGKSTWLEQQILATIDRHGPGSAFLINGDEIRDDAGLTRTIRDLLPLFAMGSRVRRLFIDEVTAVPGWQKALKVLADSGELRRVLVVTTGSKASDIRRASERLPGRKGKLERTTYLFTPISYGEFKRVCGPVLAGRTLDAYLLSGGSPVACAELAASRRIPQYVIELTRDWILGEFAASGRSRASLLAVLECLHRFAGTPVGQAKLAREAGLANNTVAAGYVELLTDLACVAPIFAWDPSRRIPNHRRPSKYPMINLLAAISWHPSRPRSLDDHDRLSPEGQGRLLEWLVAQELWRWAAIRGAEVPEMLLYWMGDEHEIDFVLGPDEFLEVKRGGATALDFAWFPRSFPGGRLTVIGSSRFETDRIRGITAEDFLLTGP